MVGLKVGIVIPAYNEELTIGQVVAIAKKYGDVIVVDDYSSDQTASIARLEGAHVVVHNKNLGYDSALDSGFKKALEMESEIVVTLDADGQHSPILIEKFIEAINQGADIVVGVRNKRQRIGEYIFALYTKIRFKIDDPLCGLKAYKIQIYKKLGHFDSYRSIGTELMIFAVKSNCKVTQIYFQVIDRPGKSRFGDIFFGNMKILRAFFLALLIKNI